MVERQMKFDPFGELSGFFHECMDPHSFSGVSHKR